MEYSVKLAIVAVLGLLFMPGCAAQIDRVTTVTWLEGSEHLTVKQKKRIVDLIEAVEEELGKDPWLGD